ELPGTQRHEQHQQPGRADPEQRSAGQRPRPPGPPSTAQHRPPAPRRATTPTAPRSPAETVTPDTERPAPRRRKRVVQDTRPRPRAQQCSEPPASSASPGPAMLLRLHLLALALVVLPAYSEQFYANRYGKRQEFAGPHGQQVGFQSGSRYGRTDPDAAPLGPDDRLQRRFYANGRYGKRSGGGGAAGAGAGAGPAAAAGAVAASLAEYQLLDDFSGIPFVVDEDSQVVCRYTGVTNLFRCARRKEGEDIPAILQDPQSSVVTGNPLN
ncbi:Envelopment polyprotein, partial [Frankliniella fusca]